MLLAIFEKGFDDVFADLAASLVSSLVICVCQPQIEVTYPDNGDFLNVIFEALRLLAGILLGHID